MAELLGNVVCTIVMLIVVALPAVATMVLTSDITPVGRDVYVLLNGEQHESLARTGAGIALLGFLFDVHKWTGVWRYGMWIYALCSFIVFLAGVECYTAVMPSIPIITGIGCCILGCVAARRSVFHNYTVYDFSRCCSIAFLLCSL